MRLLDLINEQQIVPRISGSNKEEVYKELAKVLLKVGAIDNIEGFFADIMKREEISSTALESGICMPHAKSSHVVKPSVVVGLAPNGIDCNSLDGEPSTMFFMIAMPNSASNEHVEALSKLTTMLLNGDFIKKLMSLQTEQEILKLISENQKEQNAEKQEESVNVNSDKFVLAVTACPTGIAHTFMAEEALKKASKELNIPIKVETNGTDGAKNKLTAEEIDKASGIILAIDRGVETDRFKGKKVIQTGTKAAIKDAKSLIERASKGDAPVFQGNESSQAVEGSSSNKTGAYKHLMSGVSYMLPFVISGGILIALAFIFDRLAGVQGGADLGSTTNIASMFMEIGGTAFDLFVPILAAYIAFSIGDKGALTAGFVGGSIALSGGAGFLGAIAAGFLAGFVTKGLGRLFSNTPKSMNGIKSILILPILTVAITGVILLVFLNPPIAFIDTWLTGWLNNMAHGSRLILGLLIGGMMAVDMGGPINKAAYVFAIGTLASATGEFGTPFMAAAMAGGMVPPLGIGLATILFKNKFTSEEKEAGKTSLVLGLTFITEGAIPFAAADPFRVIPAGAIGSAVAGALIMMLNIYLPVPHGGIAVIFLSNKPLMYMLSVLVGAIITCILLGILKKSVK